MKSNILKEGHCNFNLLQDNYGHQKCKNVHLDSEIKKFKRLPQQELVTYELLEV